VTLGTTSEFPNGEIGLTPASLTMKGGSVMLTIAEANLPKQSAELRGPSLSPPIPPTRALPTTLSPQVSDDVLIREIALGNRQAMEVLYSRHNVRVYRFTLRITGNPALAEDIVSEVFLDVWRRADGFKANSQVSTWLLAIARNKALSAFRRRVDQPLEDEKIATIEDLSDDPEVLVQNKERSAIMQKCLSQLSAAQREVIDLVYYHEKKVEEVAQIIGVPASTVKTRMFYARQRMGELLKVAGYSRH
jgi:RNA polymerase sigma-70 factor (ECF subfamily)